MRKINADALMDCFSDDDQVYTSSEVSNIIMMQDTVSDSGKWIQTIEETSIGGTGIYHTCDCCGHKHRALPGKHDNFCRNCGSWNYYVEVKHDVN